MKNNGKKSKFNFLDILIILIILVGAFGGYRKFKKASVSTPLAPKTQKIEISYKIEEVPTYAAEAIKVGDPVKESVQNANFGSITETIVEDSISWARNKDGQVVSSSRDGYSSLTIKMEASGIIGENGVTIDRSVYYVGQTLVIYAGNSMLQTGRISDIRLLNE